MTKVLLNERRLESVKASSYGGVRRKEIPGPSGGQRDFKWLVEVFHEIASPFQNRKSCMSLIQVAHFRLDA